MIDRRQLITLLGGAGAAWPLVGSAQQTPLVGFLGSGSQNGFAGQVRAFRGGLGAHGYREGESVAIAFRWADDRSDRLPALAADLIEKGARVIATSGGSPPVLAAKALTTSIPIVFVTAGDPVQGGMVASLHRPGGNVTGVTSLNLEVLPKRLEVLHQLLPKAAIIAALVNPSGVAAARIESDLTTAARKLGVRLEILHAGNDQHFEKAFVDLRRLRAEGLVIGTDALFINRSDQLAALAARHRIPAVFQFREFAAAGGLASYGGSFTETYRQAGDYVGRILKGAAPGELPVQQVTRVELVVNLKAAKALGLEVPPTLLIRADEVIE
jgi:putative ABC transport system substrate-binding protein